MAASEYLTPQQRILRAKLASHSRWANTPDPADRRKATRKARSKNPASREYWLAKAAEDYPDLSPEAQAAWAKSEHSKEMTRRAYSSSKNNTGRKTA